MTPTLFPAASLPFPSSATWKRRFSSRMTDPVAGLAQAASTSAPTQSFRKVTSLQSHRGPERMCVCKAFGDRHNHKIVRLWVD